MKINFNLPGGFYVMLGLVFLGIMIPCGVGKMKSYDNIVNVKGLCEREVKADKAIWPVTYKVVGNNLTELYSEIETKNGIIREFLSAGGILDSDITVSAAKISDKFAQEYGSNDRTYRYVASCTVTVCSKDIDKVLNLMSDQVSLINRGIALTSEWDSTPVFKFEGLNDIKPEMIEEATKNAREVAQKFADDSSSRLGRIKEATQGTFSIEDRDSSTPSIKKVRVVTYVSYYLQ